MMKSVIKINKPTWFDDDALQKVMAVIGGDLTPATSIFVGGCVRNTLLEEPVSDIDIATQLTPDQVTKKLEAAKIKVVPTGIDHGTVTAVVDKKTFEITTLRLDVKTDGRHAKVFFTKDWAEDAKRRDFTLNTLLMDLSGNVYDPTGLGLDDLKSRKIIFVGDPDKRIAEDYLRILRFFRFFAEYGRGEPDKKALAACQNAGDKIQTLSKERITQEFLKILRVPHVPDILELMFGHNAMADMPYKNYQKEVLQRLCDLQERLNNLRMMPRLFILAGNKASFFSHYLRLSHAQKNFLVKLEMATNTAFYEDIKALKKAIFYHGNALMLQGYLLVLATKNVEERADLIDLLQNWQAPKCPITGEMLLAEGYKTGPELGQELERRQEEWIERDFSLL